jgi:putative phosphoribosyl transferase
MSGPAHVTGERPFRDRRAAGGALAAALGAYAGRGDVVVVGLVRGGVPVAAVVAEALGVPLGAWGVRPDQPGARALPDVAARTVLVVDDGMATGATMAAAVSAIGDLGPAQVVAAVPVTAPGAAQRLATVVDEVVAVVVRRHFAAVGLWYDDFTPPTDAEVLALLGRPSGHPPDDTAPG